MNKKLLVGLTLMSTLMFTGCNTKEVVDVKPSEVAYEVNNFAMEKGDKTQKFDNTRDDWSKVKSSSKMIIVPYKRISTGAIPFINSRKLPEKKIIVVSQTIVSKDWVADLTKGSNKKDDSFKAESSNGAEFHTGITLSAKISNTDTYLSIYGIDPNSNLKDVKVQSIPLETVLEKTVKPYIQGALASEFSKYPTFEIQPRKTEIIQIVERATKERFAKDGIDILTFNSSDTITWSDRRIQEAINEKAQLEAQHQKSIVEAKVRTTEAETKRKVEEQQAMTKARAVELQAEGERKKAEIERLRQEEVNLQALAKAKNEVDIAREKAKVVSVEREMLSIEKERTEIELKKIQAQTELEKAKKWNGVQPLSNLNIMGANTIVDKDGKVQTMNLVK